MYFVWVSAIIFTSAGGFSLLPAAAMTFFGNKNSKLKIGFLYVSQGVGALLQVEIVHKLCIKIVQEFE